MTPAYFLRAKQGDNVSPRGGQQTFDVATVDKCKVRLTAYLCEPEQRLCCDSNGIETTLRIIDRANVQNTNNVMGSITSTKPACADTNLASPRTLTVVGALANRHHGMRYCLPMRMHARSQKLSVTLFVVNAVLSYCQMRTTTATCT